MHIVYTKSDYLYEVYIRIYDIDAVVCYCHSERDVVLRYSNNYSNMFVNNLTS